VSLNPNKNTNEQRKFFDAGSDLTGVRVGIVGGLLPSDVSWDAITVSYPSSTTEVYQYKTGGVSGTTVSTLTVTYTNASKQNIQSVAKS
jgi:hypothetical protein